MFDIVEHDRVTVGAPHAGNVRRRLHELLHPAPLRLLAPFGRGLHHDGARNEAEIRARAAERAKVVCGRGGVAALRAAGEAVGGARGGARHEGRDEGRRDDRRELDDAGGAALPARPLAPRAAEEARLAGGEWGGARGGGGRAKVVLGPTRQGGSFEPKM